MVPILFEDDDILAVNKPEAVAAIPERRPRGGSLFEVLCAQRDERLYVVHRIDKDTSGVIVFAKNEVVHRWLCRQFEDRTVEKVYLALVHGVIGENEGRIDKPLREFGSGRVAVDPQRGKPSLTEFRVLQRFPVSEDGHPVARASRPCSCAGSVPSTSSETCPERGRMGQALPSNPGQDARDTQGRDALATTTQASSWPNGFSLLETYPRTGRRHQIRVHLYHLGHPIVGDPLYGDKALQRGFGRLMLHAWRLSVCLPSGRTLRLAAPIPESFTLVLETVGASGLPDGISLPPWAENRNPT